MFSICPRFMVSMKWSRCITCSQAITISNAIEDFVVNSDDNEQGFLIDFFFASFLLVPISKSPKLPVASCAYYHLNKSKI